MEKIFILLPIMANNISDHTLTYHKKILINLKGNKNNESN